MKAGTNVKYSYIGDLCVSYAERKQWMHDAFLVHLQRPSSRHRCSVDAALAAGASGVDAAQVRTRPSPASQSRCRKFMWCVV